MKEGVMMVERIHTPMEILLVEDNASDIFLMEEALQACGKPYHLQTAQEVTEALALVHRARREGGLPQLIILDLQLLRGTGIDFLRTLKSDETLRKIPVIVMSSSESEQDVQACYGLHANCYIAKPMRFHDLERIIHDLMSFWSGSVILPKV